MNNKIICIIAVMLFSVLLQGCLPENNKSESDTAAAEYKKWIKVWEKDNQIFATGVGRKNPEINNETQNKVLAKNAAIANAQFNILVKVKADRRKAGEAISGQAETRLKGRIKGAQILKTEWKDGGLCVVTMRW